MTDPARSKSIHNHTVCDEIAGLVLIPPTCESNHLKGGKEMSFPCLVLTTIAVAKMVGRLTFIIKSCAIAKTWSISSQLLELSYSLIDDDAVIVTPYDLEKVQRYHSVGLTTPTASGFPALRSTSSHCGCSAQSRLARYKTYVHTRHRSSSRS